MLGSDNGKIDGSWLIIEHVIKVMVDNVKAKIYEIMFP